MRATLCLRLVGLLAGAALLAAAVSAPPAAAARKRYKLTPVSMAQSLAYSHILTMTLEPFDLYGTRDREVCQYVELPVDKVPTYCVPGDKPGDPEVCGLMIVGYEFTMRGRGAHHMVLYTFEGPADVADQFPTGVTDTWACLDNFGSRDHFVYSQRLGGTAVRRSPPKMAREGLGELVKPVTRADGSPRGIGLMINLHAVAAPGRPTKGFGRMKLYLGRPGTVRARVKRFVDILGGGFMSVPPGTAQIVGGNWYVGGPVLPLVGGPPANEICMVSIGGHHHKRTIVETIDLTGPGGTERVWQNTDWFNPLPDTQFVPPFHFTRGMTFRYECNVDNGVTTDVRMGCEMEAGVPPGNSLADVFLNGGSFDGTAHQCESDADCAGIGTGRCVPANVVWGYTSNDEMCAFGGPYFDAIPGAPPGHECDPTYAPPL